MSLFFKQVLRSSIMDILLIIYFLSYWWTFTSFPTFCHCTELQWIILSIYSFIVISTKHLSCVLLCHSSLPPIYSLPTEVIFKNRIEIMLLSYLGSSNASYHVSNKTPMRHVSSTGLQVSAKPLPCPVALPCISTQQLLCSSDVSTLFYTAGWYTSCLEYFLQATVWIFIFLSSCHLGLS